MQAVRWLLILLGIYLGLVVAFESLVAFIGARQASQGLRPGESWLVVTTTDAKGPADTVLAGVESSGHLYISSNHWLRGWYRRAVENPDVEVTRAGERRAYRAVPVAGEERDRISRDYPLPFPIRLLTGFPPRDFLRLDPR